jgi:hypothetical protein
MTESDIRLAGAQCLDLAQSRTGKAIELHQGGGGRELLAFLSKSFSN